MKKSILNKLTNFYLFLMIVVYPLLVGAKGYENILEVKYYSFIIMSVSYFFISIIIYFYYLIIKQNNLLKGLKLTKMDYLVLIFLLINVISTIMSPYKSMNLLKGLGRGEGLLITTIYVLNYFFISKLGKFGKSILKYFSISSIIVSLIAIIQFWGLNPLNLYKGISGPYNMSYMTTIGNIDFLSAFYVITISMSSLCYIFKENTLKENILYIISLIVSLFIFLLINVDSGKVAFLSLIIIVFPYILKNNKRLSKFINIISMVIFGYFLNYFVDMRLFNSGIYKASWHFNYISLGLLISILFLLFIGYLLNKKEFNLKSVNKVYYLYIPLFIIGIIILYNCDFGISFLKDFKEILHGNFDDNLGNYRLFLWKRAVILFKDYPLIGTGPDSFAMRFMTKFTPDLANLGEISINDTAANVYLTNLVNIGLFGLISYLFMIIYPILTKRSNIENKIIILVLIAFYIQNLFNLSIVIITPYLYILLGLLNIEKT